MPTIASPRFYVYVLARPNGKPFYVGKGCGDRVFSHDAEARRGHNCPKCNVIRKIWKQGGEVQRFIVFETDDEQEAFAYEIELIAMHGRDVLANLTDGGDGTSGFKRSPEWCAETSKRMKEYHQNPEVRAHLRERMLAHYENSEAREKQRARMKEVSERPEVKAGRSERAKQQFQDPEARRQLIERNKALGMDPEIRAKRSARMKEFYASPDARAQQSERRKAGIARRRKEDPK